MKAKLLFAAAALFLTGSAMAQDLKTS